MTAGFDVGIGWILTTFSGEEYVINGHHRVAAARQAGVDVSYQALSWEEVAAYGYRSADDVVVAAAEVGPNRLR